MKKIYNLSDCKINLKNFYLDSEIEKIDSSDFNVLVVDDKKENKELIIKHQDNLGCVILNKYVGNIIDIFFVPVIVREDVGSAPQYFLCKEEDIEKVLFDIEKFNKCIPNMRRISSEEISCKMVDLTSKKKKGNSNKLKILVG